MVLEIIIIKFSCILKMMSRNTFPEPQPDSASYQDWRYESLDSSLNIMTQVSKVLIPVLIFNIPDGAGAVLQTPLSLFVN